MTHYIVPLTERIRSHQQAACGAFVLWSAHSTEPTCPKCMAYLQADVQAGDNPFGEPDPSLVVRPTPEPDPIAEYETDYQRAVERGRRRGL